MTVMPVVGWWARRRIARRPLAIAAWTVLSLYVVLFLVGPLVVPGDPLAQDSSQLLPAFTSGHLLGTDDLGRDQLVRLLHGGQPLLLVTVVSTAVAAAMGSALGMIAGYFGRGADTLVMRAMDIVLAFPLVLVAILMVAVLGGGVVNMGIAITVSQVPYFARLARNLTLRERTQDYVRSARALGVSGGTILRREILPNLTGSLLVQATSTLAVAAGLASALSYLGLGLNASTPDWGYMVKAGQEFMFSNPGLVLQPGLLITVFAVACNFAGDDLADAFGEAGRR